MSGVGQIQNHFFFVPLHPSYPVKSSSSLPSSSSWTEIITTFLWFLHPSFDHHQLHPPLAITISMFCADKLARSSSASLPLFSATNRIISIKTFPSLMMQQLIFTSIDHFVFGNYSCWGSVIAIVAVFFFLTASICTIRGLSCCQVTSTAFSFFSRRSSFFVHACVLPGKLSSLFSDGFKELRSVEEGPLEQLSPVAPPFLRCCR